MNKIFKNKIWKMLEVYMNDMIVKTAAEKIHAVDLQKALTRLGVTTCVLTLKSAHLE